MKLETSRVVVTPAAIHDLGRLSRRPGGGLGRLHRDATRLQCPQGQYDNLACLPERDLIGGESGGIALRARQALDETLADWIGDAGEHDRDRGCSQNLIATDVPDTITSGFLAIKSTISVCICSDPPTQRMSMRMFWSSCQPRICMPWRKAAVKDRARGLSELPASTPMRRIRPTCCARAASGHAAAVPPSSLMKSRRPIIRSPRRRGRVASEAPRCRAPSRWSD